MLVVSREHYPSLASIGHEAVAEYDAFIREICPNRDGLLEAEHGATENDCAGACVVHTHVHLIPTLGGFSDAFENVLDEIYKGPELRLPTDDVPYIFTRGSSGHAYVYLANSVPSQFLRQIICNALGRNGWDWRSLPRDHLLNESIDIWRSRLGIL